MNTIKNNFTYIKYIFLTTTSIFLTLQISLFPENTNILCNIILFSCSSFSIFYIFRKQILLPYPISTLMLLGYSLYYFILPPIATTLESHQVTNNLVVPIDTSCHASLFFFTLLLTHIIYRNLKISLIIKNKIIHFYSKLCVFSTLTLKQIIVISIITIVSQTLSIIFKLEKNQNILVKFLDGINYFIFLPYILAFPSLTTVSSKKKPVLFLVFFSFIILLIGVIVNGRSFIFIGYACVTILYFFTILYGYTQIKLTRIVVIKVSLILLLFAVLVEPATKLAISMALARGIRDSTTPKELIQETIIRYKEIDDLPQVIQTMKDIQDTQDIWDEYYVSNPFFSRLCNLKYADNILVINKSLLDTDKISVKKQEINKIFSILPLPLIKLLNLPLNKEEATSGSMGDFLFYLTGNIDEVEGSRTGSLIGTFLIVFNWSYPFFLAIFTYIVYIICDSFIQTIPTKKCLGLNIRFSPIGFLSLYFFLFFFTSSALGMESISGLFSFILRGSIQIPVLYFLLFISSKWILFILGIKS